MHETSATPHIVAALVVMLLIATGTLAASHRLRFPFSVALVLVGMALAGLAGSNPETFGLFAELDLSAELILYVFLPTLIFESAFHLDVRQLRQNLAPVLLLAVPGLLISTLVIGGLLALVTPIPLAAALLLGAILSATDPVAVIALFKRLGAPQRLTILVEGESLFNDATSIVLSRLLVGIIAAGTVSAGGVAAGVVDFFVVFLGGAVVGWLLAVIAGFLLGLSQSDEEVEITITTVLAYLSFLIAEEWFHVSGVMATVAAGLTFGGQYSMRVSPSVRGYLEHFWEYMAFVATALIFLMVGLRVELGAYDGLGAVLGWLILAMLLSRALVVIGLLPLVGRLPGAQPVSGAYRAVLYWGGLRGAIALAIVLSLPDSFAFKDDFVALVIGAVLFTLLVQGPTMNLLVGRLGLDRAPLVDRIGEAEGVVAAKALALERLPALSASGLFSGSIADRLQKRYAAERDVAQSALEQLRSAELDVEAERQLQWMRAIARERAQLTTLFNDGHLDERPFRVLRAGLAELSDCIRHGTSLPQKRHVGGWGGGIALLDRLPRVIAVLFEGWQLRRVAERYQVTWGLHECCSGVLAVETNGSNGSDVTRTRYAEWRRDARQHLDGMAAQFPEFVSAMQDRHAQRLVLLAERAAVRARQESGQLAAGAASRMLREQDAALDALRSVAAEKLRVSPAELLRKVPFFQGMSEQEFALLARALRPVTVAAGDTLIRHGDRGESLFLIARGVVRVLIPQGESEREVATLMAGEFFGEMALLHGGRRVATVRAMTAGTAYQLDRNAVLELAERRPAIRQALEQADRDRRLEAGLEGPQV